MIFEGLSIQGFRSFVGDHVFHFPVGKGLHFIGGKNLKNPELGPNGCGKSSIWDALCWVIYGKTTRSQKAGDVHNWSDEFETVCALDFTVRGVRYSITRGWRPTIRTLQTESDDPRNVEQAEIDELVGMTFDQFLVTVVMSQFGKPFLELSRPDKLAAFTRVLGLDEWLVRSKEAGLDEDKAKRALVVQQDKELELLSTIEADRKSWDEAVAASEQWTLELKHKERIAEDHLSIARDVLAEAERGTSKLEEDRADLAEWLRLAEQEAAKRDHRLRNMSEDARELHAKAEKAWNKIQRQEQSKAAIEAMIGRCPTCRQRVSKKHSDTVLDAIDDTLETLRPELAMIENDLNRTNGAFTKLRGEHEDKAAGLTAQRNKMSRLDRDLARWQERVAGSKRSVEQAELGLEKVKQTKDPHSATAARLLARMHQYDDAVEEVQLLITELEKDRKVAAAWCKEFKDLRLWTCESAMAEFSVVMNSAVTQLGLIGWEVRAELEKPTKRGTVQRGFQLYVKSPDSPDWVPWESWCGGETQRLILAGSVAFADLECGRSGLSPSAEVWDEPTKHLSKEGVVRLLDYLHTRSRRLNKQIFLVDHRTIQSGLFASTYTVVHDKNGSRIEGDFKYKPSRAELDQGAGSRRAFPA